MPGQSFLEDTMTLKIMTATATQGGLLSTTTEAPAVIMLVLHDRDEETSSEFLSL